MICQRCAAVMQLSYVVRYRRYVALCWDCHHVESWTGRSSCVGLAWASSCERTSPPSLLTSSPRTAPSGRASEASVSPPIPGGRMMSVPWWVTRN